jgi:hypothetical protein
VVLQEAPLFLTVAADKWDETCANCFRGISLQCGKLHCSSQAKKCSFASQMQAYRDTFQVEVSAAVDASRQHSAAPSASRLHKRSPGYMAQACAGGKSMALGPFTNTPLPA